MNPYLGYDKCTRLQESFRYNYSVSTTLSQLCEEILDHEENSHVEEMYGGPMVLIGMYISIASLFCILAMTLDLLNGFRTKKFWFPTKYFSLNAASITVITVAMKLPVDLTSPMPGDMDQAAKVGGLAFMCTMMSNFMPSLASMDNKSLLANVIGLSILVITLIVNAFIQIRTHVIVPESIGRMRLLYPSFILIIAYIYIVLLLFLLIILISSAITLPTSKENLEFKYQASSRKALHDLNSQESLIEKLRQVVKRYWIMAETSSPQFVMASNSLSSASGIICATSMLVYVHFVWVTALKSILEALKADWDVVLGFYSVYKWSIAAILITQYIGIVVGSIAPISRCFTVLSFKSYANQNKNHFLVFKVEKYWIQKLCEWKEIRISYFSSGQRSRVFLHSMKNLILKFCIRFQKVIVVSCKIIGLIPIMVIIFVVYCSYYVKSLKASGQRSRVFLHSMKNLILKFCIRFQKVIVVSCKIIGLIPIMVIIFVVYCSYYVKSLKARFLTPSSAASSNDTNEDLSNYVLLLEDNMPLAERTMKGISDSMNRLIQNAGRKQHGNLLKLLEKSDAFNGVETFDTDQVQSILSVEPVNSWSLPIISLTCIAVALPNIDGEMVDNLFTSVGEGLLYTHLVEECLNTESVYSNIRRKTVTLWHEVQDDYKWLETPLKRSAYQGKTAKEIVTEFAHTAEEIVNEFKISTNGEELVEKGNLPPKIIVANSMYRIAQTIIHTYYRSNLEINEEELFTRLSIMIADILAACFTNIPRVITLRCHESVIERRESSVKAAVELLGRTTRIIERPAPELPNMDPDKMGFIDEWRFHLRQP